MSIRESQVIDIGNRQYIPLKSGVQSDSKTIYIEVKYLPFIARFFSPVVMNSLIKEGRSAYLHDVLQSSGIIKDLDLNLKLGQFFEQLYNLVAKYYRNEYVYKNAIVNKILLGRYSLNTSSMLTEFRVGGCKADVVILNGTSIVYEIKSEYDSLERIARQIDSYIGTFDLVNVLTSSSQLGHLEELLPFEVGLIELTNNYTMRTVREAVSIKARAKPRVIFDSLRQSEYFDIINKVYGFIPDVPNVYMYTECKELFSKLSPVDAHDEMVRVLSSRQNKELLRHLIPKLPMSLRAYVMGMELTSQKVERLRELLDTKLSAIVIT